VTDGDALMLRQGRPPREATQAYFLGPHGRQAPGRAALRGDNSPAARVSEGGPGGGVRPTSPPHPRAKPVRRTPSPTGNALRPKQTPVGP